MCGPYDPLFTLSQQFPKTPISACFSSLRTYFQQKSQFFTKLAFLEPKFRKILVSKTQILQNFSSKASNWVKIHSSSSPYFFPKNQLSPYFCAWPFFKPHLWPFGPHTYTKMKVEYPPGSRQGALLYVGDPEGVTLWPIHHVLPQKRVKKGTFHDTRVSRWRYEKSEKREAKLTL